MSEFRGGNFNVGTIPTTTTVGTDERHSASKPAQNQVPRHSASNSVDRSEESFSAYLEREDKKIKRAETQSADAHDIRVSAALLSATVATFIGASIRGLQIDPLDKWAFYLAKTYELLSEDNQSDGPLPSTLVDPSKFSPANSVVLINSFWFLSLVVSLTCIMLSSLAQRWANERKLDLCAQPRTEPRNSRAFSASVGAEDKPSFPWLIEALPFLLRLSLALFFAGFGVFVFNLTAEFGTAQALILTSGSLISPLLYFWHI